MKILRSLTLVVAFSFVVQMNGQLELFHTDSTYATGIELIDERIYISYTTHVSYIDLNDPEQEVHHLYDIFGGVKHFTFDDTYIYLSVETQGEIYRWPRENPENNLQSIYDGSLTPSGIATKDDILYFSNWGLGRIYTINLNDPFPATPVLFLADVNGANGMQRVDDDLYVCQSTDNQISRIDLSNPEPVIEPVVTTGLSWPFELACAGNEIYVSSISGDQIVKFELGVDNPTPVVVFEIDTPTGIDFYEGTLFIMLRDANQIQNSVDVLTTESCPGDEPTSDCPYDLDDDNLVMTSDLLLFLAAFGCVQDCGEPDFNADNTVNTSDLLEFLTVFGGPC
jgi:hypothetical protein